MTICDKAFRRIQNDKELYRKWVNAKTEHERTEILCEQSYLIGISETKI